MKNAKKLLFYLLIFTFLVIFTSFSASADMGPKPSVNVKFENVGDEECYATLLSATEGNGPWGAWGGNYEQIYEQYDDPTVFLAFAEYEDADGYYFWQRYWNIGFSGKIDWSYYPPNDFKVLVYYPASDTYLISSPMSRYAFDSYYTVDLAEGKLTPLESEKIIAPMRSYDYKGEIISLIIRVVITVAIEILVALVFGFLGGKMLLFITGVNVLTQLLLNLALNYFTFYLSESFFGILYIMMEPLVFIIEAILFCIFLSKLAPTERKKRTYVFYAFLANLLSMLSALFFNEYLPSIL